MQIVVVERLEIPLRCGGEALLIGCSLAEARRVILPTIRTFEEHP